MRDGGDLLLDVAATVLLIVLVIFGAATVFNMIADAFNLLALEIGGLT